MQIDLCLNNGADDQSSRPTSHFCSYRPQRSCGQGYVFTRVCDSVNRGEGVSGEPPQPGRPPWDQGEPPRDQADPPGPRRTPPEPRRTPPGPGRPPNPPWDQGEPPPRGPRRTPPRPRRPPQNQADPPPPREEHCSIPSMSGRYASYWNAFLLNIYFLKNILNIELKTKTTLMYRQIDNFLIVRLKLCS